MRILVQICNQASVKIDEEIYSSIGKGYVLFVSFKPSDDEQIIEKMIDKLLGLRIFADSNGKTNLSIFDVGGEILSVSQFTLYANVKEGRRPSFVTCMPGEQASKLYDRFNELLNNRINVKTGKFGADMKVNLINDGPFTIWLDSEELFIK